MLQKKEAPGLAQYLRSKCLLRLDIECIHKSCGGRWTLYTTAAKDADEAAVTRAVRKIALPMHVHLDEKGSPSSASENARISRFEYDFSLFP